MKKKLFWLCAQWKGKDKNFRVLFFTVAADSLSEAKITVGSHLRYHDIVKYQFGTACELPDCYCETELPKVIEGVNL
jgi:hypothetical protein